MDYWQSPIFEADPGPKSTNLRALRFHESEIDPQALEKILSFPRHLEHFQLTHQNFLDYQQDDIRRGVNLVIEALLQQQVSLESLRIQGLEKTAYGMYLDSFRKLRLLETSFELLFGDVGRKSGGADSFFDLNRLLPSSVQQLTLRYRLIDDPIVVHRLETLSSLVATKATRLPNLRQLILAEERPGDKPALLAQGLEEAIRHVLDVILRCSTLSGIDARHEVKSLEANPWSPRLREMMGFCGNKDYRESYEQRWGSVT
jgi:hypothetical protein